MQLDCDKNSTVPSATTVTDNPVQTLENILLAVSSDCTQCGACVKQCAFLQRHGNPREIALAHNPNKSDTRTRAFECALCGLCKAVCPQKVDTPAMNLQLRRECVNRGEGTLPEHGPLVNYERLGMSRRFTHYGLPAGCTTVFFPGCSFAGTRPHLVQKVLDVLRKNDPSTGVVLDCCGKPSHDLGRQEYFLRVFGELADTLASHGIKTVVTACPHCHGVFSRYGAPLKTVSVYELLEAPTPDAQKQPSVSPIIIHDPCGTRFVPAVQSAVRTLIAEQGYTIEEPVHHGSRSICCGSGAAIPFTAPDLSAQWTRQCVAETKKGPVATYCCGCLQKLGSSVTAMHVLDLYFAKEDTLALQPRPAAKGVFALINRMKLKTQLKKDPATAHVSERISTIISRPLSKGVLLLFAVAAVLVALVVLMRIPEVSALLKSDRLQTLIASAGWWAPVMYIAIYCVAPILLIPTVPLAMAAGILFGPLWGVVYTMIGATSGAAAAFLFARYLVRDQIKRKLYGPRWKQLDESTRRHGWKMVALVRLVPLFPYNLVNYAFGLTNVTFTGYVLATALFMLPGCVAFIVFSSSLPSLIAGHVSPALGIGAGLIALMALIPVIYRWKQRSKQINKKNGDGI